MLFTNFPCMISLIPHFQYCSRHGVYTDTDRVTNAIGQMRCRFCLVRVTPNWFSGWLRAVLEREHLGLTKFCPVHDNWGCRRHIKCSCHNSRFTVCVCELIGCCWWRLVMRRWHWFHPWCLKQSSSGSLAWWRLGIRVVIRRAGDPLLCRRRVLQISC